ncbi:hypothetical protein [Bacillus sp. V3-13]|uniref:hypothetical protein n=1 Tax=Bacillus sp. V3-13 TaxID=2053728 RepID=UPI002152FFED|nr:hypothetical protein [Bacillus sp. V3-13]
MIPKTVLNFLHKFFEQGSCYLLDAYYKTVMEELKMPHRIQQAAQQVQVQLQQIQQIARQLQFQEQRNAQQLQQLQAQTGMQMQAYPQDGIASQLQYLTIAEQNATQLCQQIELMARQLQQQQYGQML